MRTRFFFFSLSVLVQAFCSGYVFGQNSTIEQRFVSQNVQLLWPVNCSTRNGLERSWSNSNSSGFQELVGVDAVWGGIRKASVVDGDRVEITGHVGGSVCELFVDGSKREYIWRTESIRDNDGINVYINVRHKHSTSRVSRYFKLKFIDDYRYELSVSVDDFFSPEDAEKIRAGKVLKSRRFYMIFKLNVSRDNNTPAFYQYTYDVSAPEGRTSQLMISPY
jgi:hypothetical protein